MKLSAYRTSTILTFISLVILLFVNVIFIFTTTYFFKKEAISEAKEKAELILDRNLAVHDYYTNQLKPNLLATLNDSISEGTYFEPVWMSSSYAIENLEKYFQQRNKFGYYYKDASINARNPRNEADSIEINYIQQLNKNHDTAPLEGIMTLNETQYYYVLKRGEILENKCLQCHSTPAKAPKRLVAIYGNTRSFNRNVGDIISAVSIRIPLNEAYARANHNILLISVVISVIVLLVLVIYLLIQKQLIFIPLGILQEQSIAISQDNSLLGETIKVDTTKDLTDFINSFNTMSNKLYDYNCLLEEKVTAKTIDLEYKIEEVEQLNRNKDLFLTILAHDLKNPFTMILGFLDLLVKNVHKYDINKIEKQLKIVNDSANNTYKLLDDLLLWGKAQSGKLPFEPTKFVFKETCELVISNLISQADAKNISINCIVPEQTYLVADLNMIRTILRNLVSNGIKFTNQKGCINISVEKDGFINKITVADNGIGMDENVQNRLWDSVEKHTTSGTANEKGSGLGLSICKEFVEKHEGQIWVESVLGQGTKFIFTIPDQKIIVPFLF